MHHRGGAAFPDCAPDGLDVANITLDERRAQRCFFVSGRQVVEDNHPAARTAQSLGAVAADVTRTSGDENRAGLARGAQARPME